MLWIIFYTQDSAISHSEWKIYSKYIQVFEMGSISNAQNVKFFFPKEVTSYLVLLKMKDKYIFL